MNWILSETGGWNVAERIPGNSISQLPHLPDEIILFIYKLSRALIIRDIKMRGCHPIFNTFRGFGFSSRNGSYIHLIKRNVNICSETTYCRDLDINGRVLVATIDYFTIIKSIKILIRKEFNWLQSKINMLQNETIPNITSQDFALELSYHMSC